MADAAQFIERANRHSGPLGAAIMSSLLWRSWLLIALIDWALPLAAVVAAVLP